MTKKIFLNGKQYIDSVDVGSAMSAANKGGGLAGAQSMLSGSGIRHGASPMASAVKSGGGADNSLRMESVAKGGMMRAFGAGRSGMVGGSLGSSMSGFGAGMSAIGIVNRVIALITAVSLVFGIYSIVDPQYSRYVYNQAQDKFIDTAAVVTSAPKDIIIIIKSLDTNFTTIAQDPIKLLNYPQRLYQNNMINI